MLKYAYWLLLLLTLNFNAQASEYAGYLVRSYQPTQEQLGLYLKDEKGEPFKKFERLKDWLSAQNQTLVFAMNAGMYQRNFEPLGLLVIKGKELGKINLREAQGNFYWKPNGVFYIDKTGAHISESTIYAQQATDVQLAATQSGPLLLQAGQFHPQFTPNAISRLIRNGVGIAGDQVYFVISTKPVNFYEFASFFKDELKCSDALYLDGVVSAIYDAASNTNSQSTGLGPIFGLSTQP